MLAGLGLDAGHQVRALVDVRSRRVRCAPMITLIGRPLFAISTALKSQSAEQRAVAADGSCHTHVHRQRMPGVEVRRPPLALAAARVLPFAAFAVAGVVVARVGRACRCACISRPFCRCCAAGRSCTPSYSVSPIVLLRSICVVSNGAAGPLAGGRVDGVDEDAIEHVLAAAADVADLREQVVADLTLQRGAVDVRDTCPGDHAAGRADDCWPASAPAGTSSCTGYDGGRGQVAARAPGCRSPPSRRRSGRGCSRGHSRRATPTPAAVSTPCRAAARRCSCRESSTACPAGR